MGNQWFRKRKGLEGIGYSIAGWKGLVATVIFIAITTGVVVAIADLPKWTGLSLAHATLAGAVAVVVLIVVFIVFVVAKSRDRR